MSEHDYIRSLAETGAIPTTIPAAIADLIDNMGDIPGSAIRYNGEEIWLHTSGQVEGWLRGFMEAYRDLPEGVSRG